MLQPKWDSTWAEIIDYSNLSAWHSMSASAPATMVACTNNVKVLNGVLSTLDMHEFVFEQLMGLVDALGCACALSTQISSN